MEKINFFKLANFTPKQKLFLEFTKTYRYTLWSGAVGSGKSRALRWIILYWLLYWGAKGYRNVQGGLFCRTYPELNDRHLKRIKTEFPDWLGTYYEQKHEFHLSEDYGGGILMFRNLDEVEKYFSNEWAIIGVDELTQIPKETFDILLQRNRWPGIENPKFLAVSNPVGEFSNWVREFFVEKTSKDERCKEAGYLKAEIGDNPYLPENYYEELAKGMDEPLKKALLEGNWYSLEGVIDDKGYLPLLTSSQLQNAIIDVDIQNFHKPVIGIDPGAGGDETAIVLRDNFVAKILFNKRLSDTMQILPLLSDCLIKYQPVAIVIDITGIGKGIYDRLNEIGLYQELHGVQFGQKASYPERFFNKKAELYWKMREWILTSGKLLKDDAWNEILTLRYKEYSDRVIKFQSKEELLKKGIKSPNVADALSLTFAVDLSTMIEVDKIKEFMLE